jgi:cobalt-zinc-cadmium efflux system outer membrane protein
MDQAIDLARRNNPALQAQRTLVYQSREDEVTANLRPNPTLSWDAQYLPLFDPHLFSSDYTNQTAQFDAGIGYLFERGRKRQNRLAAARTATAVTEAQVADAERTTIAATAQQFISALLAKSTLDFSEHLLDSYQHTVDASQQMQKNGKMTQGDLLKIQLQTLQFQNDVTAARITLRQALNSLRQLVGFDSVPRDYDIVGELRYTSMTLTLSELQARALATRPDLEAARRGVAAAQSQIGLAKAQSKQDVNVTLDYTHVSAANLAAFYFQIPLPVFNRNQGEVARTYYALTQSQFLEKASEQQVLTDVKNAYETLLNSRDILQMYDANYLGKSQQSLDLAQQSYASGSATLLDFLDAQRSYRSTELSYRQGLASYMGALQSLREAVGVRDLQQNPGASASPSKL